MEITVGTYTKPAAAERESELIGTIDQLIELADSGTLADGQKPYAEVTVEDEKSARKFMYEMQLGARQRGRGFRRTRYEVLDAKGKPVAAVSKEVDGKEVSEYPADKIASVIVGGTLGKRHRANGQAAAETATAE